ncbi:hypothetical protein [Candidatus Tisiphia endosymbiont of Nemotelus uliginosus]|uniref:hypothetical protein n=1 Tax=Candidatus Tisiphia endosymbiont of Nemotelus uliginosus TaxID=3077926 RepID=UPI0035C90163
MSEDNILESQNTFENEIKTILLTHNAKYDAVLLTEAIHTLELIKKATALPQTLSTSHIKDRWEKILRHSLSHFVTLWSHNPELKQSLLDVFHKNMPKAHYKEIIKIIDRIENPLKADIPQWGPTQYEFDHEQHEEKRRVERQDILNSTVSEFNNIAISPFFQKEVGRTISKEFTTFINHMVQAIGQNKNNITQQEQILNTYVKEIDKWWEKQLQYINKPIWQKLKEVINCTWEVIKSSKSPISQKTQETRDKLHKAVKNLIFPKQLARALDKIPPSIMLREDGINKISSSRADLRHSANKTRGRT